MKNYSKTHKLVICAMVAGLYTALCLVLWPLSFGMVQIRFSEALTLLPVFSPVLIWGVTLGCALSNLVGFLSGTNPLGYIDVIVGTSATLIAAVLSYLLRKIRFKGLPILAALPPVLVNAFIIGAELTFFEVNGFNPVAFAMNFLYIAVGQAIACFGLGLVLVYALEKTGIAKRYLTDEKKDSSIL